MSTQQQPPYIALLSIHGLIRAHELELGRDVDTGGQIKYVVELARTLGEYSEVGRVDLLTRRIISTEVSDTYAQPFEVLNTKAQIVRLDGGPNGYIAKEQLWDYLDSFADNAIAYFKQQPRLPDILHSHYADAGYVAVRIANLLGIPLIHTGHSLGRSKRRQLLAAGHSKANLEERYRLSRRIEAEELVLGVAERVITSTRQEIHEQYGLYDQYQPHCMRVIPPGTDLTKFYPPSVDESNTTIAQTLRRFLIEPNKPIILALARPNVRKNLVQLLIVYGESSRLQELANLVLIVGSREDIREMESMSQEVLTDILLTIDRYNLYGKVAYPKQHDAEDVPVLYRLATASHGVFINPALTEPFGLTLLEAAASGLPILATDDGGPQDIIANCQNGYLINPLDQQAIQQQLEKILSEPNTWQHLSQNGLRNVRHHYAWQAHVEQYLMEIKPFLQAPIASKPKPKRRRQLHQDRAIVTDLDQNLLGNHAALQDFLNILHENRQCVLFAIATGRRLDSALQVLKHHHIPLPDILLTSLGTEIYHAPNLVADTTWERHIEYLWNPRIIRRVLGELNGLMLQPSTEQSRFKISYFRQDTALETADITRLLQQEGQAVTVIQAFGNYLDIIPIRASKGLALRWFADHYDIPLTRILAAGGSGADLDMLRGNTLGVVVANRHHEELAELNAEDSHIFFAKQAYAAGLLEAIEHYHFFQTCEWVV